MCSNKNEKPKRLGEILIELEALTENQLDHALKIQKQRKKLLGQVLISLGYCDTETIITALDVQGGSIFDTKI